MAKFEDSNRPLSEYTIPVNELLDSGIAEVEAFGRQYLRSRIFGLPSPPRSSALSLSHILEPEVSPRPQKRERRESLTPVGSDEEDEEKRITASFLLNLASPEAVSREEPTCIRKKKKSRYYADNMTRPFAQMVRPAYEYMPESATVRYGYNIPQSPPQSPPEITTRVRARPGRCARRAQGCNENTKFRPVISDWTCYKNYEPCPKDSQVGWCNKCWCNKGHYSEDDFYCRKFDLLEDQIMVWIEEFHVPKFEVWLNNKGSQGSTKTIVDPIKARLYVSAWREEWKLTGRTPNIKIRPL